jgi:hypothetical protein
METFAPPHPTTNLSPNVYFQIVHTLTTLLPPPLDDSSGALHARNHTAIAKVASMYPVNANEAHLAARSVVAGAQADDIMRLIRENAHDMALTTRLHAQYASMARTSTTAQAMLIRVQAVRRKREAIKGATDEDAWTRHVVEQSMRRVADPATERVLAASPGAAREETPAARREAAPEAASAEALVAPSLPRENQEIAEIVSEYDLKSHDMVSETPMSEDPPNQALGMAEEMDLRRHIRAAIAELLFAGRASAANGPESSSGDGLVDQRTVPTRREAVFQTEPQPTDHP